MMILDKLEKKLMIFMLIGARFAVFQTKMGLIEIIQSFKVDVCDKTPIPYINNPRSLLLAPTKGIFLKFSRLS